MGEWASGFAEANGIRIHYLRTGGAKPPLVLAHGFTDDGGCWAPVAAVLAADYDAVMVDARGHGRSDAPPGGYGAVEQAADLAGVIEALGLRKPAILGHSMGAETALALAGVHPDLPGAILLEDPPPRWVASRAPVEGDDNRGTEWRNRITTMKRQTRDELLAAERAASPAWSEAELEPWADAKLRLSPAVLARFEPGDTAPGDWAATLGRIRCPALLLIGNPALGALVDSTAADALRALVPGLSVAHIAGAGHNIRRDQPDRYLEAVRPFLAAWAVSAGAA